MIESRRRRALVALALLVPVPSVATWVAMVAMPGDLGQALFFLAKLWIVLVPVCWLVLVDRGRPHVPRPRVDGMATACVTGVLIFLAILGGYWFTGRSLIDADVMRAKALEVGLDSKTRYLLGALYWCTINSILEEYVWRWFVFTRLEVLLPRLLAVVGAGLLFTLHHIIAIDAYFDWRVVVLASLGVFIGGTTWSWIYLKYRNIWAAYVSHVFADLAVFGIGWVLIFQ